MKFKENSILPIPPASRLSKFEAYYRINLPEDYRKFLEIGNCGIPIKNIFQHENTERLVERFLCMMEDPNSIPSKGTYDISVVITQIEDRLADNDDLIGMNIIPIAYLFGGDFICLDFRGNVNNPKVMLWDHNLSDELSPHVELVSNNFTNFLEKLYEPDDE